MNKRDFYEVLELLPTCTPQDIRQNYRKLALKWHPDKNNGTYEAHKKFSEIQEAHSVLSDQRKKKIYDTYGHKGIELDQEGHENGNHKQQNFFFQKGFHGTDKTPFEVLRDICTDKHTEENLFGADGYADFQKGFTSTIKDFFHDNLLKEPNSPGENFFESYKPTFLDPTFSMFPPDFERADSYYRAPTTSFFSYLSDVGEETTHLTHTLLQSGKFASSCEDIIFEHENERKGPSVNMPRTKTQNNIMFQNRPFESPFSTKQRAKDDNVIILNDGDSPFTFYEDSGVSTGCSVDELEREFNSELRISSKLSSPSKKISKLKDTLSMKVTKKRSSKKVSLR